MAAAIASTTSRLVTGTSNASSSPAVPLPAGLVAGDVVAIWAFGFLTAFPAGWTLAAGQTGTGAGGYRVFTRVVDGTEGASVTFALFDVGEFAASRLTGVDGTTPLDVTPAATTTGYTGSPPAPAVTTVTDGALVITTIIGGPGDGAVPITSPGSGYTLDWHDEQASYWALAHKTQTPAGDTGTFNWTTGGAGWFLRTLAFRPASAPPPLAAGTLSESSHTGASAVLSWTSASGGTPAYAAQLQKSPSGAGTWANVAGATASPATVTGLSRSTAYDFRVVFTDALAATATSNTVVVTTAATTAFATNQAGNWSSASIWTPASVPTAGDTATVNHAVTADIAATIGASGVTGTAALTVADGVTLTVAGIRLTARGDVVTRNHFELSGSAPVGIAFLAGSGLRFDVPTGQEYALQIGHVGGLAGWTVAGTEASPVTIDRIGAGRAVIRHGAAVCGTFAGTWLNVSGLGDASTDAWTASLADVAGCTFSLADATFAGCGAPLHFSNTGPAASWSLVRVTSTGSVGGGPLLGSLEGATSIREVQGCSFDVGPQFYPAYNVRVRDSFLGQGHDVTGATGQAWTGNFIRLPAPDGLRFAGNLTDNVIYMEGAIDNPHPVQIPPVAGAYGGNLFSFPEASIATDAGDMFTFTGDAASPVEVIYADNLVLPIATGPKAGYSPGVLSSQGYNANIAVRLRHNTTVGRQGILARVQETFSGHAGMVVEMEDNLVADLTGSNEAYLAWDVGSLPDAFAPAGLDFNATSGAGSEREGGGYNAIVTGTRGVDFAAQDISGDPRFLAPTRNPHTWDASLGGAGTSASLLARLAADPSLIATMRDWIRAGFAPTNPAYATAAHDGTTIGAVAYTSLSQVLTGTGIAPRLAIGSGTVTPGRVTLVGTGIASGLAIGSGSVTVGASEDLPEDLLAAIRALFLAGDAAGELAGGLHPAEVPDGADLPYATVREQASREEFRADDVVAYSITLGLCVYAATVDEAGRLGDLLQASLIGTTPTFAGAGVTPLIAPDDPRHGRARTRAKDGGDVWTQDRQLRCRVIKEL